MPDLITKQDAYEHLRLDYGSNGSADDGWLDIFIPAVSEAVATWLKDSWRLYEWVMDSAGHVVMDSNGDPVVYVDSNGDPVVRWAVKAACLVELASQYRYREGEGRDNVVTPDAGYGYTLNKVSTALLTPLRRPTVS